MRTSVIFNFIIKETIFGRLGAYTGRAFKLFLTLSNSFLSLLIVLCSIEQ